MSYHHLFEGLLAVKLLPLVDLNMPVRKNIKQVQLVKIQFQIKTILHFDNVDKAQ